MYNKYIAFGPIIGDICGSRYEFNNYKGDHDIKLFDGCWVTDDTVHTLATMGACIYAKQHQHDNTTNKEFIALLQKGMRHMLIDLYKRYPNMSYGSMFRDWAEGKDHKPYGSYGNGAAMRVSPVAYIAECEEKVLEYAEAVTVVTHNTAEAVHYAQMVALSVWYALQGYSKDDIYNRINGKELPQYSEMLGHYYFDESCQGTVPMAMSTFFESNNFIDCVIKSIQIGGDTDTLAAIACSVAGAYYRVPPMMGKDCSKFLDSTMRKIIKNFYAISNIPYMNRFSKEMFNE